MLCRRHTSPIVKGRDMLIADLEPIYVDDPSTAFAAAWEELMMLLQSGRLASVDICVRFPDGAEHEIVRERDHASSPFFSTGMDTMRTRSARRTLTWLAGSMYLLSLRRRSVSAIAATIATSRITAAISKGYTYSV